jgi:hypothetical protein
MTVSVHPTQSIRRLRKRFSDRRAARFVDASRADDLVERGLIEGRLGDWKDDLYAASGNGVAGPGLPEATPKELYEEFEHDQSRPQDPAP